MRYHTLQAVKYATLQAMSRLRGRHPEDALLICSDPRGGSTWLMEMLVDALRPAVVWEPFHKVNGVAEPLLHLEGQPFVPAEHSWEALRRDMSLILSARKLNGWSADKPYARYLTSSHVLVKVVRANALLPWLTRQFAFRRKPIHLIRHPGAFASSAIRYFKGVSDKRRLKPVTDERAVFLRPGLGLDFTCRLETLEEQLVARWCLHNVYTLRHEGHDRDWIAIRYEELLFDPASHLSRLEREWDIHLPDNVLAQANRESRTAHDFDNDKSRQLSKWRAQFDSAALDRMQSVLDAFGIVEYSIDQDLPHSTRDAAPQSTDATHG